ncbi:unnamed protein product [Schistocephalus solidus]|uniref:SH2 domain-containing protein n=1 Tax=Schistocephalus solidus TaxID=70667 RepID=A0A183T520_SCHSO|nr:unnamed protein product [Schistocephalus solidus]
MPEPITFSVCASQTPMQAYGQAKNEAVSVALQCVFSDASFGSSTSTVLDESCLSSALAESLNYSFISQKNRAVQCEILSIPLDVLVSRSSLELEDSTVSETLYAFSTSHSVTCQTARPSLLSFLEFDRSFGFAHESFLSEYLFSSTVIRDFFIFSSHDHELDLYISSLGVCRLNTCQYDCLIDRGFIGEFSSQAVPDLHVSVDVSTQWPAEIVVQEEFDEMLYVDDSFSSDDEDLYLRRLQRGQISESACQVQSEISSPELLAAAETEVTQESLLFSGYHQVDLKNETKLLRQISNYGIARCQTAKAAVSKSTLMLEDISYTESTRVSRTIDSPVTYHEQLMKKHKRVDEGDRYVPCLHDLDVTTYFFDEDIHEEEYRLRLQHHSPALLSSLPADRMVVQMRQQVVDYELCQMVSHLDSRRWNDIREVASPITGLFAPINIAIRRGWIQMGNRNEYIDPSTGHHIPLETALAQGRLRMANTRSASVRGPAAPSLMFIERESFGWYRAEATHVVNTITHEKLTISQARSEGLIKHEEDGSVWIQDTRNSRWVSVDEAVASEILFVENIQKIEYKDEVEHCECTESTVRAYHVDAIKPAGEPCEWLGTDDAVRLGFFNPQTGEVAVDWPARPAYPPLNSSRDTTFESEDYTVHHWCSFLTARQAGWIKMRPELNARRWVPLTTPGTTNSNRRLIASTIKPIYSDCETIQMEMTYHHEFFSHREDRYESSQRYQRQHPSAISYHQMHGLADEYEELDYDLYDESQYYQNLLQIQPREVARTWTREVAYHESSQMNETVQTFASRQSRCD